MALINVPVHLQDRFDLCGPACVQMVIRTLGGPLSPQDLAHIGTDDADWYTTPTRIETMINAGRPQGRPRYKARTASNFTAGMAHVTASLAAGHAVVALASGGEHWVVVRGVTGSGASRFVHVRDPFPDRTLVPGITMPLSAHVDGDDCDEGDQLGGAEANQQGHSDEVLRWNAWKTQYFTPCANGQLPWKGFRVVVSADIAATPTPEPIASPMMGPSTPILEPVAIEMVQKALISSDLAGLEGWAEAIHSLSSVRRPRAIRVDGLAGGAPYFLVVFADAEGRGIVAQLDAQHGELLGARLMSRRLARSLLEPAPAGHRRYVWQQGPNSFYSPYFPFSEIAQTAGAAPVYQRTLDRKTFHALTERPDYPD